MVGPDRAAGDAPMTADLHVAAEGGAGRISVQGVDKVYCSGDTDLHALKSCSLDIAPGEFIMLIGPSGCGKTTLLNAIAGFDTISSGRILLDGKVIASPSAKPSPGADRIVVFQNGALFPWKTVLQNLVYGLPARGKVARERARATARQAMERSGLSRDLEPLFPGELSSGMKRKVEIIRALINDPKVLLLDEPFRALDKINKTLMHNYLLHVYAMTGKTILFVTHDIEEAIFLSDRVLIMTTRPGTIKTEIVVDIPRPRDLKIVGSRYFNDLKEQAVEVIREESLKAFHLGEREMA